MIKILLTLLLLQTSALALNQGATNFVGTVTTNSGVNVGISSTNPGQALDVKGMVRDSGEIVNGNVGIGTSVGNAVISGDSNGNIGIGTTSPGLIIYNNNGVTGTVLQVNGTAPVNGVVGLYTSDAGNPGNGILLGSINGNGFYDYGMWASSYAATPTLTDYIFTLDDGGGGSIFNAPNSYNPLSFRTNNSTKMYISPGGNVGIGTTKGNAGLAVMNGNVGIGTWNSGQALDVNGTIRGLSGGTCTTLYLCQGGVDAGVWQTSACNLCPASTCVAHNGCF